MEDSMNVRPTRYRLALAAATLALVLGASPVAGYKHLGTTGNTGTHSLTDTRSSPGGECDYRFQDAGTMWALRHVIIDPPNAQASAFHDGATQQVGWRFTVHRKQFNAFTEPGPWTHRYTSPTQKATTDADHDA